MRGTRTMVQTGLVVALLLLGAAACGDSGDGGGEDATGGAEGIPGLNGAGSGGGDGSDTGAGMGEDLDPCALLDAGDVEEEFGERGSVADGQPDLYSCVWEVGDQTASASGTVSVSDYTSPCCALDQTPTESAEATFQGHRDLADNPVDVEGVGDGAFFEQIPLDNGSVVALEQSFLTFRTGELVLSLQAAFGETPVEGVQGRLVALADRVVDRV